MDLDKLRELVKADQYRLQKHALRRLDERGILIESVLEAILNGEIIEDYPTQGPFPSCLMLGWVGSEPLHVVLSMDEKESMVYIITVYRPSFTRFESDWKTRKK